MPDLKPLEYDRSVTTVTVRGFRTLIVLLVINTLMLGWFVAGPQASQFAKAQWSQWKERRAQAQREQVKLAAQQAARVFQFPEKHVAYTEVPDEAMKLVSQGLSYRPVATRLSNSISGRPPPGWQAPVIAQPLVALVPGETAIHGAGLLFLHERKSPDGTAALVKVGIGVSHAFEAKHFDDNRISKTTFHLSKDRILVATAFAPGAKGDLVKNREFILNLILPDTDSTPVATIRRPEHRQTPTTQPVPITPAVPIKPGNQLRLFGGSPDPADVSHFTIPFELDGNRES